MGRRPKGRTPGQNKKMWGLVSQLKTAGANPAEAEEALRAIVVDVSGQRSTRRLSRAQADEVIRQMRQHVVQCGGTVDAAERQPWGPRGPGPRDSQTITPRQQQVIQALFEQAGIHGRARQAGFCKRQCKVPWPQTQAHADQLVEPLKAMVLRAVAPVDAWQRVADARDRPGLTQWEAGFLADMARQFEAANAAGDLGKVLSPHKLLKLIEIECKLGIGVGVAA